jgi:Mg-chelatase subunit ChlD
VAYNSKATVALAPVYMTAAGLASAEAAIDALRAGGQTNIWDGLYQGLKV